MRFAFEDFENPSTESQQCTPPSHLPTKDAPGFPSFPVRSESLLCLELLLRNSSATLEEICGVVRADFGLSIELLRMSGELFQDPEDAPWRLCHCVVEVGKTRLLHRLPELRTFPEGKITSAEIFAQRSLTVAGLAESLAALRGSVDPERAYFAGLFQNVSELDWMAPAQLTDPIDVAQYVCAMWHLPEFVSAVANPMAVVYSAADDSLLEIVCLAGELAKRGEENVRPN